jgi:alkylated DNA repair protein (DNA oxidative demethylase)
MLLSLDDDASQDRLLDPGARLLAGLAKARDRALLDAIQRISEAAPFRNLMTPGGKTMSVAMTNCGTVGWVSDRRGYRYDPTDPLTGRPWPAMPDLFLDLAKEAAEGIGFSRYVPDACLINRYAPGTRLTLHQDRDEIDSVEPIVSVSLGVPAVFLWGGQKRSDRTRRIPVFHGDVVVWGGPARMTFHGVDKIKNSDHPLTGPLRYNLTFRKAL